MIYKVYTSQVQDFFHQQYYRFWGEITHVNPKSNQVGPDFVQRQAGMFGTKHDS